MDEEGEEEEEKKRLHFLTRKEPGLKIGGSSNLYLSIFHSLLDWLERTGGRVSKEMHCNYHRESSAA